MAKRRKSSCWIYALFFYVKIEGGVMEEVKQNKMAVAPMKKLFWKMGLPMIISMVL